MPDAKCHRSHLQPPGLWVAAGGGGLEPDGFTALSQLPLLASRCPEEDSRLARGIEIHAARKNREIACGEDRGAGCTGLNLCTARRDEARCDYDKTAGGQEPPDQGTNPERHDSPPIRNHDRS